MDYHYQEEMNEIKDRIDRLALAIDEMKARQGNDAEIISRVANLTDDLNGRFERVSTLAHNRVVDIEHRLDNLESPTID